MSLAKTDCGALRGVATDGAEVFLGVPYAAPPLGPRRLRPPLAHDPWTGTRDATRFGPAPPQRGDALSEALGLLHGCRIDFTAHKLLEYRGIRRLDARRFKCWLRCRCPCRGKGIC